MRVNFFLFPFLCSIALSLLFILFNNEPFPSFSSSQAGEGIIIISLREENNDRFVRESLDSLGLGSFISESSQIVYLDDFTGLRNIALDLYDDMVLSFDPRNDGYPALLRSFFVRDGRRYFYLLLDNISHLNTEYLNRQLYLLFPDFDYELIILGGNNEGFPPLILMLFYFALCFLTFLLSAHKKYFLHFMPLFLALGFSVLNINAFVFAMLIFAILEIIRQPLLDMQERENYRKNFILIPLLLISLIIYSFLLNGILNVLLYIGAFTIILFLISYRQKIQRRQSSHILFSPILFFPVKIRTYRLFPLLLPFLIFLVIFPGLLEFSENIGDFDSLEYDTAYIINADDYYRHINFQLSFSHMPLGQEHILPDNYFQYFLDEDGLISARRVYRTEEMDLPPFPLYKLMDYLILYKQEGALSNNENIFLSGNYVKEWIMTAFILFICLFDIFRPGKRTKRFTFFEKIFRPSENKDLPV